MKYFKKCIHALTVGKGNSNFIKVSRSFSEYSKKRENETFSRFSQTDNALHTR
jgi:hypothetical protein